MSVTVGLSASSEAARLDGLRVRHLVLWDRICDFVIWLCSRRVLAYPSWRRRYMALVAYVTGAFSHLKVLFMSKVSPKNLF